MSNAVDILFIGGPKHGQAICAPKPLTATYSVPVHDGQFVYEHRLHIYAMDQYHIAVPAGTTPDPDEVNAVIVARNFPSAWEQRQPSATSGPRNAA